MRRIIAAAVALAVLVLLAVVAQLVLPGIAENRIRDRLAHDRRVESVHVSAFPAGKLLWGRAAPATLRMANVPAAVGRPGDLLRRTPDAGPAGPSTPSAPRR